jgi:uncharacterized protein
MWGQAFEATLGERRVLAPGRLRWLRALAWLVVLFLVVGFLSTLPGMTVAGPEAQNAPSPPRLPGVREATANALTSLVAYAALVWLGERRAPREIDPRASLELVWGAVAGAVIFSLVMATLAGLDHYEVRPDVADPPTAMIGVAIVSGVVEEVLFRAIVFRLLTRAFNVWWALGLSSLLFGGLHLGNDNATVFSALAIGLEAGVLLAAFYLWTGRIWASIGAHAAWNFTQGYIFGTPVSGIDTGDGVLDSVPDAADPVLLTGGAFGPEASLAALVVATGAGVLIVCDARRRARRTVA